MSPNWTPFPQNTALQSTVNGIKDSVIPVIDTSLAIVKLVQTIMDIIVKFYVDLSDPLVAAVIAALEAVKDMLKDFAIDTGVYALGIGPVSLATSNTNTSWWDEYVARNATLSTAWKTLEEQIADAKFESETSEQIARNNPVMVDASNEVKASQTATDLLDLMTARGNGGNAGFYRTVAESLQDSGDSNRPKIGPDGYVAGMFVLAGATTYGDLIEAWRKLTQLLKISGQDDGGDPGIPRPKNVIAKLVGSISSDQAPISKMQGGAYAVKLSWDPDPVSWQHRFFSEVRGDITQVVIYRQDKPIKTETPISQLTEISRFPHSGVLYEYYDTDSAIFKTNTTQYYAVGYAFDVIGPDGTVQKSFTEPQAIATAVMQFGNKITAPGGHGVPPDWASMNAVDLFPILKSFIDGLISGIDSIEKGLKNSKDRIKEFLDFLNNLIDYYATVVLNVTNQVKAIIELLNMPNVYIGLLPFAGKGGTDFMLKTLADKLVDRTDPNRPAFDTGSELVAGFVIMAGADTPGKLVDLEKFLALFTTIGDAASDALRQALESIGTAVDQVTNQICFTEDMVPVACTPHTGINTNFGPDMEPGEVSDNRCS